MEPPERSGEWPDTSFLRLMLINDIIQADDTTLYAMATVLHRFGLLDLTTEDDSLDSDVPVASTPPRHHLRLVQ